MNRIVPLVALALLLLAGCTETPRGDAAEPDEPGVDPPAPAGNEGSSGGAPQTVPTADLEAAGCISHAFNIRVEREALRPHVPAHLNITPQPVVTVQYNLITCDALLFGNETVRRDDWFAVAHVRILDDDDAYDSRFYLLEVVTGWPEIAKRWGALGVEVREGTLTMEASEGGTEFVLTGGGLAYRFTALPRNPGQNAGGQVHAQLLAGPEAETAFDYDIVLSSSDMLQTGLAVESEGGMLGAITSGVAAGTYVPSQSSTRIHNPR